MGPDGKPMGIPNIPITPAAPQISGSTGFNVPPPAAPPPYSYNSVPVAQPYNQVCRQLTFNYWSFECLEKFIIKIRCIFIYRYRLIGQIKLVLFLLNHLHSWKECDTPTEFLPLEVWILWEDEKTESQHPKRILLRLVRINHIGRWYNTRE